MKNHTLGARLAVVIAMTVFGTIGIFRHFMPGVPSGLLASLRGVVGALFLLALLYVRGGRLDLAAIRKNLFRLIVSGVVMGFNWILLFEAYRYTSVATATLCYYMAPILVILASPLVLGERLTARKLICVAIAVGGMIPVTGVLDAGFGGLGELRGIALGLGAAVLYACVVLINQRITDIAAYDKTIVQLGAAGIALIPYVLLAEDVTALTLTLPTVVLMAVICIVHTGIAYALYFGAMGKVPAQTVALLSYIDPVLAVVLSAVLLRQGLNAAGWIGAILVLGATIVSELPTKTARSTAPALQFGQATQDQYDEIIALYAAAIDRLATDGIEIFWDLDHHPSRDFLRGAIERGELYVATREGRILGAMVVDQSQRPEYADIAWGCDAPCEAVAVMHVLAISPDARGQGVATFMLSELTALCRMRGVRSIRLDALNCNTPACALYRRAGYSVVYAGPIHIPDIGPHDFEVFELVL